MNHRKITKRALALPPAEPRCESVDSDTESSPKRCRRSNPASGFRSQLLPGGPLDDDPSGGDADRAIRDSLLDAKPVEPQTHTSRAGQAWKLVKAQLGHGKRLREPKVLALGRHSGRVYVQVSNDKPPGNALEIKPGSAPCRGRCQYGPDQTERP